METCQRIQARQAQAEQKQVNGFLLDTHYWLWFQMGNVQRLNLNAKQELLRMQQEETLFLSAVSVLEVARLVANEQIDLGTSIDEFLAAAIDYGALQLVPLTPKILIESTRLPGDLHRDPSDRILAATAREHGLTLVTRDRELLRYARKGHLRVHKI
jgi:PIN domain nuclease of toxin-antitoxin system